MKMPAFNRILIIALLISIVAGFLCGYFYDRSSDRVIPLKKFQKEVNKKEVIAENTLKHLITNFQPQSPDSSLSKNKDDIAYYVFNRHGLLLWTDNQPDISTLCVEETNETRFVQLSNAACIYKSLVKDSLTFVALIKIKVNYPVENELLVSKFLSNYHLTPAIGISEQPDISNYRVYSVDKRYLFSLTEPQSPTHNNNWAYLGIVFFSIAFVLFFLLYVNSYRFFGGKFSLKSYLIITFFVFIVTALSLYLNIPTILYWSGFFSPFEYASNAFLASILHLTIATGFIFSAVYLFYFRVQPHLPRKTSPVLSALFPLFYLLVFYMISGLVYHSSFHLNILHFSDISFNRLWIHFLVLLWGASLIMLFYQSHNRHNLKKTLIYDLIYLVVIIIPSGFIFGNDFKYFVISYVIFGIALYLPVWVKRHIGLYLLLVWWTLAFINLFVWNTLLLDSHKKAAKYEVLCKNILISGSSGNDAMADILLEELDNKISSDVVISRMVAHPDSILNANIYINQNYLRGFWNKYDVRLSAMQKKSDQAQAYENYILTVGIQLKNTHFYSVPASFNDMSYLGIFPVANADSLQFYLEFYPRKNFRSYSFPNLFTPPTPDIQTQLGISTAKYEGGNLLFSTGNTDFPESDRWIKKNSQSFDIQKYKGRKFYIYHKDKYISIVLSEDKPEQTSAILLYLFYIGVIYLLLTSIFTSFYQLSRHKWKIRIGLTAKFQYSFIALLVISFMGIFYVSVNFIHQKYREEQSLNIENKKKYIQKELQEMYYWTRDLSLVNQQTLNFDLQELSYKYQTDIHVYDNNGMLVGSSQPLIFNRSLISRLISPQPFFSENSDIITRENIGNLSYLTGYTDFYNGDYLQIGYIAVPQYFSQAEIRTEIESFLAVVIHIYLVIIILVVLLSLFIGKQLSAPLNMLQQKLRQMRFGERNEKIEYTLNDEIGQLVVQYNKTVDELERSARMLAQSERESAWKTMARQIAHEINNPLTPMKLTIQQLQRTFNMNDKRFEDYFLKSTKTLVEQIDNLSRIATTFSNFARMPEARFERMDVAERLFSVVQLFANNHEGCELKFEGNNSGIYITADPEQLTQVFNNLLKNAIQSIPTDREGLIVVTISVEEKTVIICITDNGCGIPQEVAEKMFTPNFTTKSTGMGLGLAISRNIVEMAGGTITFFTSPNEGTTFSIILPL
jgi:two-component system, NtrC family, nitrogen regulation sensor histidine kinase NtrY